MCLDISTICQLHILLSRTAQISLELHFCVELHTKKSPVMHHKLSVLQLTSELQYQCAVSFLIASSPFTYRRLQNSS